MFDSPVAVAIRDLYFNIRSKEIEDYFLTAFRVLTSMTEDAECKVRRRDVEEWLNQVKDTVYRTEDFVDKIPSEALNDRLDATSQTKKSTLHKIHFRPMWVTNLPFWPKQKRKVKKGIQRESKKIVNEFKSLQMQGEALELKSKEFCPSYLYYRQDHNWSLQDDITCYKRLSTFFVADSEVFRRDRDEEAIIELLLSDDGSGERLSVIPIVAEDGMGKTTLARRVYDNHRVSEHFDLKA